MTWWKKEAERVLGPLEDIELPYYPPTAARRNYERLRRELEDDHEG